MIYELYRCKLLKWNVKYHIVKIFFSTNRHTNIEISGTDEARFVGPSDENEEAASIQSDVPIPVDGNLR